MRRIPAMTAAAVALSASALGGISVLAGGMKPVMHGPLKIEQPWTRATPPGAKVGAGYLTVTNTGSNADRLVAVSTPIAEKAEIHDMRMDGGVMTMRPLADGLAVPPGETIALQPGGLHLMLMKLKQRIETGSAVSVTLVFERAGAITLDLTAAPMGAKKPAVDHAGEGG